MAKQETPKNETTRRVMARITKAEGERTKDGAVNVGEKWYLMENF